MSQCQEGFQEKTSLSNHEKVKHNNFINADGTKIEEETVEAEKNIEQEYMITLSENVFSCDLCDFETETSEELVNHRRNYIHDVNMNNDTLETLEVNLKQTV